MKWRIWFRYRKHLYVPILLVLMVVILLSISFPQKAWLGIGAIGLIIIGIAISRK